MVYHIQALQTHIPLKAALHDHGNGAAAAHRQGRGLRPYFGLPLRFYMIATEVEYVHGPVRSHTFRWIAVPAKSPASTEIISVRANPRPFPVRRCFHRMILD